MNETNTLKWNANPKIIIALFIVFFPLGLYFMWKNSIWSKKTRWIVTGIISIAVIGNGLSSDGNGLSSDSNNFSPNGTYTLTTKDKYSEVTHNVVVNGEKWTRISEGKYGPKKTNTVKSGLVYKGYLFEDEYNKHRGEIGSIGKINEDGTLTFKSHIGSEMAITLTKSK